MCPHREHKAQKENTSHRFGPIHKGVKKRNPDTEIQHFAVHMRGRLDLAFPVSQTECLNQNNRISP